MSSTKPYRCIVFMGSARDAAAPWGGPARLGDRVLAFTKSRVEAWNAVPENCTFELEVFDTLLMPEFQAVMTNPVYYQKPDDVPPALKVASDKIGAADCYLIVTPEYNHSMPSALTNMMNFFGSSKFGFKPSACVCYSGTPIGGPRVAAALRPYLSELGCLPISKQVIYPSAASLFNDDGTAVAGKEKDVTGQMDRMLDQFGWWTEACANQKVLKGLPGGKR